MDYSLPGSSAWDFPGKYMGVCRHFLLQGIFPDEDSSLRLLQVDSLPMSHLGSPTYLFRRHNLIHKGV